MLECLNVESILMIMVLSLFCEMYNFGDFCWLCSIYQFGQKIICIFYSKNFRAKQKPSFVEIVLGVRFLILSHSFFHQWAKCIILWYYLWINYKQVVTMAINENLFIYHVRLLFFYRKIQFLFNWCPVVNIIITILEMLLPLILWSHK